MNKQLFSFARICLGVSVALNATQCVPTPPGQSIVRPQGAETPTEPAIPTAMSSTSSATVVAGGWIPPSVTRDPRIVVAFNNFDGALSAAGGQIAGTSIMGVARSDDHGQTWNYSRIPYPTGASFLSAVGGNPSIASTGWMQARVGNGPPPESTLAYVAEAFFIDPTAGGARGLKLVCSSSNDGGFTWSAPRPIPPMLSLNLLVSPSRPTVTIAEFGATQRPLLAFVGDFGQDTARVVVTDAAINDMMGDCRFRAPIANLFEMDAATARSLRRVKLASNRVTGPVLAVEYKANTPDTVGGENSAVCRTDLLQIVPVVQGGQLLYSTHTITSTSAPCRQTVPNDPAPLDLSHFDLATDAVVDLNVPNVNTSTTPNSIHLVSIHDATPSDGVDGSEVVYQRIRTSGGGATQTHSVEPPIIVSDAAATGEIVFQPSVSAVALPMQGAGTASDVFVTWYQMNANRQVRLLGRRRFATTGQWSATQVLHSPAPDLSESICTTDNPFTPIWSNYGATVAMIDGWPARGALSDLRAPFPIAVTLFTSSRSTTCSERTENSALFQELHAARWR